MVEDEVLFSVGIIFDTRAFISALETNIIVRPQGIGGTRIKGISKSKRKSSVMPHILSESWVVGLKTPVDSIKATTQMGYRTEQGNFSKGIELNRGNYGTACVLYTNTLFSGVKFQQGARAENCSLLIETPFTFKDLRSRKLLVLPLHLFLWYGAPQKLHSDNAIELTTQTQ